MLSRAVLSTEITADLCYSGSRSCDCDGRWSVSRHSVWRGSRGTITVVEVVQLYKKKRMPCAWTKQQVWFVNGTFNMASGEDMKRRNRASRLEPRA